jgi:DNA-3-methyladenine glycosylase II
MNSFKESFEHLNRDPVMSYLIKKFGDKISIEDRYEEDLAKAISQLIIEQQVSFKAAITIKKRFNSLIKGLSHQDVLKTSNKNLQSIGISFKKVEYIKNVYDYFLKNNLNYKDFTDSEVTKELTKIKGIGKWTAEMFLIFILFRKNIFSNGDLALINSIKVNYNINNLSNKKLDTLKKSWSPHKTTASLLLWKSIEEKIFFQKDN